MRFDVLTLFPEIFTGYLSQSLLSKAIEAGLVQVKLHNFRDYSQQKHQKVDDRPFGGGPGMVLMAQPIVDCVEALLRPTHAGLESSSHGIGSDACGEKEACETEPVAKLVMLSPQGRRLNQKVVEELADSKRLVLLCGRYEGFDERIKDLLHPDEISVGDYVLNGGETAAMVIIDAVIRFVPGVLGDEDSRRLDSFSSEGGLLEYPQYTRPRTFRGLETPEILISGDHQAVAKWRQEQSEQRTRRQRPDLLDNAT